MTFDPMIITWDILGLIGDYCGKIQLNSDKVQQSYIIKTKIGLRYLTLQRVVVLTSRYQQHVNIGNINMLSIRAHTTNSRSHAKVRVFKARFEGEAAIF